MKTVSISDNRRNAILKLKGQIKEISNQIPSEHYTGAVVSWKCMATMYTSLAGKILAEHKGDVPVDAAVDLLAHVSSASAITDFVTGEYGREWLYYDTMFSFQSDVLSCVSAVKLAIEESAVLNA